MTYAVETSLSTTSGSLLLHVDPYSLEKGFGQSVRTSKRRTEGSTRWVEGSVPTSAVKENRVFPLAVYIEANNHDTMDQARRVLEHALDQRIFTATVTEFEDGVSKTVTVYTCFSADHSLELSVEYRFATMCLLKADVATLPSPTVNYPNPS